MEQEIYLELQTPQTTSAWRQFMMEIYVPTDKMIHVADYRLKCAH